MVRNGPTPCHGPAVIALFPFHRNVESGHSFQTGPRTLTRVRSMKDPGDGINQRKRNQIIFPRNVRKEPPRLQRAAAEPNEEPKVTC